MSELEDGRIPPHTPCPYRDLCPSAQSGDCGHRGAEHTVAYSCGFARLFDVFKDV